MAGTGEDGETRIFCEAGIGEREFAEKKCRAARGFNAARVKANGAEAGAIIFRRIVGRGHEKLDRSLGGIARRSAEKNQRGSGCEADAGAAGAGGGAGGCGCAKRDSSSAGFSSILSMVIFCLMSLEEVPESISKANFMPYTSR